jgi:hypothetical protein
MNQPAGAQVSRDHNFAAHSGDEQLELTKSYVLVHPDRRDFLPFLPTMRMQPDVVLAREGVAENHS